jgi:hypothetical protein
MDFNREYFLSPYYFFLKEGKNDISVYFSVSNTLTEARKKDEVVKFNKKHKKYVEEEIEKISKDKKHKDTKELKKSIEKKKDELEELVDYDGSFLSSKIPIVNPYLTPKGTNDQEVVATRQTNNPITRGSRVYWGESVDDSTDEVINETDMSDAFGYEETKDLNGPETFKTYIEDFEMDPIEAVKRTKQQGKEPNPAKHKKKVNNTPKKIKDSKNYIDTLTLVERENLEEERKKQMSKMVEDIILGKKSKNSDVTSKTKKTTPMSQLLKKNLNSIKKIADKEGINIKDLINFLKGE